jgi:hypothetical protein
MYIYFPVRLDQNSSLNYVPVYDKRLSEDEGEWSDDHEDEENELEEFQTETHIFFYSRE